MCKKYLEEKLSWVEVGDVKYGCVCVSEEETTIFV